MTNRNLPWYKRCPADWQNGTRRCGMSMEERGFYSECLDAMWELQGILPADRKRLALLLGCNPRTVAKLLPRMLALGKLIACDGGYYNPRMAADIGIDPDGASAADDELAANACQPALASNSSPIQLEFARKVRKKPMNSTREKESESDTPISASAIEGEIRIEGARVVVPEPTAAVLAAEYPGVDVSAVADLAAPEILRFRAPSAADKLAVVRKWARVSMSRSGPRRPIASARGPDAAGGLPEVVPGWNRTLDKLRAMSAAKAATGG